jgi:aspartokinase/homoserine dehydrogenase 1
MKVLKFGGTSVGSTENIRIVKKILEGQETSCVVVVSAFGGVTDQIIRIATLASESNNEYMAEIDNIRVRHLDAVKELIAGEPQKSALKEVKTMVSEFGEVLRGVYMLQDLSDKTLDYLLSFGERLSATIIAHIIDSAVYVDSRKLIHTDSRFGNATVHFDISNKKIISELKNIEKVALLPGFIASDDRLHSCHRCSCIKGGCAGDMDRCGRVHDCRSPYCSGSIPGRVHEL